MGWGREGEGSGLGGQGGCERRIEVFVKIQKKKKFWGGGGGSVGVFVKIQKKKFGVGEGGGGVRFGGSGWM